MAPWSAQVPTDQAALARELHKAGIVPAARRSAARPLTVHREDRKKKKRRDFSKLHVTNVHLWVCTALDPCPYPAAASAAPYSSQEAADDDRSFYCCCCAAEDCGDQSRVVEISCSLVNVRNSKAGRVS